MILVQTLYPEMLLNTPICRTISVSTKPGLIAFTVTPVPVNLRANSRVNIILANLLWLYASPASYFCSLFMSAVLILPLRCAELDTFMIRLGADFYEIIHIKMVEGANSTGSFGKVLKLLTLIKSSSKFVSRKCPKWLTPNCISTPSFVCKCLHLITPALFIKMSNRFSFSLYLMQMEMVCYPKIIPKPMNFAFYSLLHKVSNRFHWT